MSSKKGQTQQRSGCEFEMHTVPGTEHHEQGVSVCDLEGSCSRRGQPGCIRTKLPPTLTGRSIIPDINRSPFIRTHEDAAQLTQAQQAALCLQRRRLN